MAPRSATWRIPQTANSDIFNSTTHNSIPCGSVVDIYQEQAALDLLYETIEGLPGYHIALMTLRKAGWCLAMIYGKSICP